MRIVEVRSLRRSPAKHIDLLPQDQVFRFQRCSRLEARTQDTENQLEQIGHQDASLRRPLAASTPNRIVGTHRVAFDHSRLPGRMTFHHALYLSGLDRVCSTRRACARRVFVLSYAISIWRKQACYGLSAPRQWASRVRADV